VTGFCVLSVYRHKLGVSFLFLVCELIECPAKLCSTGQGSSLEDTAFEGFDHITQASEFRLVTREPVDFVVP
jgi:hypothetical protein